jgi:hypothetical protein
MNGAAVRNAFEEGITRMEAAIAASRRIARLSLANIPSMSNGVLKARSWTT